jgi:hypothetical protein
MHHQCGENGLNLGFTPSALFEGLRQLLAPFATLPARYKGFDTRRIACVYQESRPTRHKGMNDTPADHAIRTY